MSSHITNLVLAFDASEITVTEFADSVQFLRSDEAQFVLRTLSSAWLHTHENDQRRLLARQICRQLSVCKLCLN